VKGVSLRVLGFLGLLLLASFWSVYSVQEPVPDPLNPAAFSLDRALQHLEAISEQPHAVGSRSHGEVQGYLLENLQKAGLEVEVQNGIALNKFFTWIRGAYLKNVLARLGHGEADSVVFTAHYDSAPNSPGAADDGAGVAVVLALAEQAKMGKNDQVFLFSDGEELGLLGASLFLGQHPWAAQVGMVLNLEARGRSGPSVLFQVSQESGPLIDLFSRSPYPFGSSLFSSLSRLIPNDTDFTIFFKTPGSWAKLCLCRWPELLPLPP